ncbi:hypothetical protein POX_c03836 [Penicillium oxalicum]|uniref:hypothetical protein n=1 Tax=Penicillium oxalicum TaxID=69781 RepID=UPI0020B7DA03|nr:hypothetical protein POX_c03836 [Penicillium oxalicum]KAI2790983.1 hypothetical protein POX_c03836 [Penicillium oxalicum]
MSAFHRVRRLVGLEGGIHRQPASPATSSSSSISATETRSGSPSKVPRGSPEAADMLTNSVRLQLEIPCTDSPASRATEQRQSSEHLRCPSTIDFSGHDGDQSDTDETLDDEAQSVSGSPAVQTVAEPAPNNPLTIGDEFQKEVLGVENAATWYDEENGSSRPIDPFDPQLEALNRAFEVADMSMSSGVGGMPAGNIPNPGMFANYTENSPTPGMGSMPRPPPSPAYPHPTPQVNGGGPGASGMPMNAGHQMDLHHLYEMVLELSEVLKNNREVTKSIVSSAEEIMKHGTSEDASAAMRQVNGEISAARISELERALAKEKRLVEVLKHEQTENVKLIGEYETTVGVMVEQIRNYCQNNNMHYLYQKRHYNNLLQAERDAHLESRLDRDYWHTQTMKCAQMIRTAYRLRSEEDGLPIRIIAGLQNEVRAYRNALGMEPEKPEQEYGWEILKDVPGLE